MCERIICPSLEIGRLGREDLKPEGDFSGGYNLWGCKISTEHLVEEVVELVGVRCCQFDFLGVTPLDDFFKVAIQNGLELCPDYLPFSYLKHFGGKGNETFIFATEPKFVSISRGSGPCGVDRCTTGLLSVHRSRPSYAVLQPYGSGVEFAFMRRIPHKE